MGSLVGQHRISADIANGKDMADIGTLLLVRSNKASFVDTDAGFLRRYAVAIGTPAYRNQDPTEGLRFGRIIALETDSQTMLERLYRGHLDSQKNPLVTFADSLRQRPHKVRIAAGHQLPGQLNDCHPDAESVIDGRHLEADYSAADYQQAVRQLLEFQRSGGIHDSRIIRQPRQHQGFRACANYALIEPQQLRTGSAVNRKVMVVHEFGLTGQHPDFSLSSEPVQATSQFRHHVVFPTA